MVPSHGAGTSSTMTTPGICHTSSVVSHLDVIVCQPSSKMEVLSPSFLLPTNSVKVWKVSEGFNAK